MERGNCDTSSAQLLGSNTSPGAYTSVLVDGVRHGGRHDRSYLLFRRAADRVLRYLPPSSVSVTIGATPTSDVFLDVAGF